MEVGHREGVQEKYIVRHAITTINSVFEGNQPDKRKFHPSHERG